MNRPHEDQAARDPSAPFAPERSVAAVTMGRVLAAMAGTAATFAVIWLLVPHSPNANETAIALIASVGYLFGAIGLAGSLRPLPHWVFHGLFAAATVLVSAAIYFNHTPSSVFAFYYVWIAVYVFYFFRFAEACAHMLLAATCYGIALVALADDAAPIARWLITVGTLVSVGCLISMLKQHLGKLISSLAESARRDPLTGLLNRRGLQEAFNLEVERASRRAERICLLLSDLDNFKTINDRVGHQAGDEALIRVGQLVERTVRRIDSVARIGGEELAIVAPDTDTDEALVLADRIRDAVASSFKGDPVPITMSVGIARHGHGQDLDGLLRMADQALYAAKDGGRNRSVVYDRDAVALLVRSTSRTATSSGQLAPVQALAESLDFRDGGTLRHSKMVARYAQLIARELGLSQKSLEHLLLAAILHDVGKIGVPDSILRKPGPLSNEEWTEMRKHPAIGAQILEAAGLDRERDIVMAHHERLDGHGYPRGLAGDAIPLEAKILAVADAYETMTADRPYRPALADDLARRQLVDCSGAQFDVRVVEAFMAVLDGASGEGEGAREVMQAAGGAGS
jgi:diguanylate cyclase (GGDEF)-like protein/putative nucleotidyltransferase with HDIG domain